MPRRLRGFARRSAPPASRSGSTRASCGAGMPGTGQIRQQIHDCALFLPIISQLERTSGSRATSAGSGNWRSIGRTTWLRAWRSLFRSSSTSTTERDPTVPDKFSELQWTRLPAGETPPVFVERVQRLLSGRQPTPVSGPRPNHHEPCRMQPGRTRASAAGRESRTGRSRWALLVVLGLFRARAAARIEASALRARPQSRCCRWRTRAGRRASSTSRTGSRRI